MEIETTYLTLKGKLPLDAVDTTLFPPHVAVVYKAAAYCNERGESFPLSPKYVWQVAQQRYLAKDDTEKFLRAVQEYQPHGPLLDSIRDALILRKLVQQTTEQLAKGEYNLDKLRQMLTVTSEHEQFVSRIAAPKQEKERYLVRTGISPLDAIIGGFKAELAVVAARPKHGKSTFFFNIICNTPAVPTVYVTIADYGKDDVQELLYTMDPTVVERDNLRIADFTSFSATLADVEGVIAEYRPALVIVDRAEKLLPPRQRKESWLEKGAIAEALRRLAKRYTCPVLTDSQINAEGEHTAMRTKRRVDYTMMAGDHTERAAVMDLFFGLFRSERSVFVNIQGRRRGLPQLIELQTDESGRYIQ